MSSRARAYQQLAQVRTRPSAPALALPFQALTPAPRLPAPTPAHPCAQQVEAIRAEQEAADEPWVEFPDTDEDSADQWWDFTLSIDGPVVSGREVQPYAGGVFRVNVKLSDAFAAGDVPRVKFMTRIWHPFVRADGKDEGSVCHEFWEVRSPPFTHFFFPVDTHITHLPPTHPHHRSNTTSSSSPPRPPRPPCAASSRRCAPFWRTCTARWGTPSR